MAENLFCACAKACFKQRIQVTCLHSTTWLLQYACPAVKFDRNGYKNRDRLFMLADNAIYLVAEKKEIKDIILLDVLKGMFWLYDFYLFQNCPIISSGNQDGPWV